MGYKLGYGQTGRFRRRILRAAAFVGAFTVGCTAGILMLLQFNKGMSLAGFHSQEDQEQASNAVAKALHTPNSNMASKKLAKRKTSFPQALGITVGPLRLASCGQAPLRAGLATAQDAQLKKLAEYEQVCPGAVSGASFFVGTPETLQQAQENAEWIADTLKEFAANGITPLVFMEPTTESGELVEASAYRQGAYDGALDAFFAALKAQGITDATMGTWVPWPEANIPVWTSVDPGDFVANVTKTVQFQKKHFPGSKAAVMLESRSYPSADTWEGGKFVSLLPYVQGIPAGLIDSFGLQGFTWPPTDPDDTPILDPKVFLRVDLAAEAATSLGVKQVWLNTGTFARSTIVSTTNPYTLSPEQRQAILDSIFSQVKVLKGQGFEVVVHLFNKDKLATDEHIDWSYWPAGDPNGGTGTGVLKTFMSDAQAAGIPLWVFDN